MKADFSYLIIGNGRVAKNFCYYLGLLNIPYQRWYRSKHSLASLEDKVKLCSCILLLITDKFIKPFISNKKFFRSKILVHFSGALVLPKVLGFHPLFSFTHKLCDLQTYKNIVFVGEKGSLGFQKSFLSYQIKMLK